MKKSDLRKIIREEVKNIIKKTKNKLTEGPQQFNEFSISDRDSAKKVKIALRSANINFGIDTEYSSSTYFLFKNSNEFKKAKNVATKLLNKPESDW